MKKTNFSKVSLLGLFLLGFNAQYLFPMARFYFEEGADEIVFYDITASSDQRDIMIDVVRRVAREIFIPFSVGGGIRSVKDMHGILMAGAEKVSVNTAAMLNPNIISEGARAFGSQCIVLGVDAKKVQPTPSVPSGYEIVIHGGRTFTGMDALISSGFVPVPECTLRVRLNNHA